MNSIQHETTKPIKPNSQPEKCIRCGCSAASPCTILEGQSGYRPCFRIGPGLRICCACAWGMNGKDRAVDPEWQDGKFPSIEGLLKASAYRGVYSRVAKNLAISPSTVRRAVLGKIPDPAPIMAALEQEFVRLFETRRRA